jgi:phosphate transport system protein
MEVSMTVHLTKEIETLKKNILALSAAVEESVHKAVKAIDEKDGDLAREVIDNDGLIDQTEVDIEEECLKLLALHQPVAIDLRFIVAVLKINSDLERIGDLAVNLAERALYLYMHPPVDLPFDFRAMAKKAQSMLKSSLDALVNMDEKLAARVIAEDDAVDAMNLEMYIKVQGAIKKDIDGLDRYIHFLSASRHLERIADHATNIAEDVIYMINGEIVRHKAEDFEKLG